VSDSRSAEAGRATIDELPVFESETMAELLEVEQ